MGSAALAIACLVAGVAIAAFLHSTVASTPPAMLGLLGYVVFARRAMHAWHGSGVPCAHLPPCWQPWTIDEDQDDRPRRAASLA